MIEQITITINCGKKFKMHLNIRMLRQKPAWVASQFFERRPYLESFKFEIIVECGVPLRSELSHCLTLREYHPILNLLFLKTYSLLNLSAGLSLSTSDPLKDLILP